MAKNDEIRIRIDSEMKERVTQAAEEQGLPVSRIVQKAVDKELARLAEETERPFHERKLREEMRAHMSQLRKDFHSFTYEMRRANMFMELGGLHEDSISRLAMKQWEEEMAFKKKRWSKDED